MRVHLEEDKEELKNSPGFSQLCTLLWMKLVGMIIGKKIGGKTRKWRRQPLWLGTGIAKQNCQAVMDYGATGESTHVLEADWSV